MYTLSNLKKDNTIVQITRNISHYFLLVNDKQVAQIENDNAKRINESIAFLVGLRAEGFKSIK